MKVLKSLSLFLILLTPIFVSFEETTRADPPILTTVTLTEDIYLEPGSTTSISRGTATPVVQTPEGLAANINGKIVILPNVLASDYADAKTANPGKTNITLDPTKSRDKNCDISIQPNQDTEPATSTSTPPTSQTGSQQSSGANPLPVKQVIDAGKSASEIGDQARGFELIDAASARQAAIGQAAAQDQVTLSAPYRDLPIQALGDYLQRAQTNLSNTANTISQASGGLEDSEKARFQNTYLNASDKAALGAQAVADAIEQQQNGEMSPFKAILSPGQVANPLAKTAALADIFGPALPGQSSAATADALTNRMIMLSGLPPDQQAAVAKNLKLIERPTLTLANGNQVPIQILHNGYILGAGSTGIDCSTFVSMSLPADVRKGKFTTLDYYEMWQYQRHGRIAHPPTMQSEHEDLVRKASEAFIPIDVQGGEKLAIGDLLLYRIPSQPIGHVFIVKNYHHERLQADVIEAAQSAGTVREREFWLSIMPQNPNVRIVRPGFYGLRIKPVSTKACTYKDHKLAPQGSGVYEYRPGHAGTSDGTTPGGQ